MRNLIFFTLLIFILSCTSSHKPETSLINGLASPFQIQGDTSIIYISDYTTDFRLIDSIRVPEGINLTKKNDSVYSLLTSNNLPPISKISVFRLNREECIPVLNRKKQSITIKIKAEKNIKNPKIIGSMNDWNRDNKGMTLKNGDWEQSFELFPGAYEYLIYTKEKEFADPANPLCSGNNSLIKVGKYLPEDLPFIQTVSHAESTLTLSTNQTLDNIIALWQNQTQNFDTTKNKIVVKIPKQAKKIKRSFLRIYASNKNGIANDILIPLEYGKIIENTTLLTREDRQTMIMYFLMVDRFFNGDTSNDEPVADPEILPIANYLGGDLAGVVQKMKEGYFSDLGINTLWLSPITQNPLGAYGLWPNPHTKFSGYHGYWPISNVNIDYRFGTKDNLHKIVSEGHKADMNILLDYVANHVHEEHPVYKQHPDWATKLYLPDGTLNTEKWNEHRLTTWFDTFLPTLDLRRKVVVNAMVDSALYWITEFDIDGFRHDATKHVDELYWRTLTRKIRNISPEKPFYQIGETYGSPMLISSYIGTGMVDAQFDFNTYDNAVECFALPNENFERLKSVLADSWKYYGYHNLMGNISGNQDRGRFISYAGGSLSFNENAKLAGWTRKIDTGTPDSYSKLKMLHAFNLTIPGIPVIYYGDEIGMPGGNDPDNRRMMRFSNLNNKEKDVKQTVKKLISIRKNNMALLYGQTRILQADSIVFAFTREYFNQKNLVVFNKSKTERNLVFTLKSTNELKSEFNSKTNYSNEELTIEMKPQSFDIVHF